MRTRKAAVLGAAALSAGMLSAGPATAAEPEAPTGPAAHQVGFTGEANGFASGVSRTSCDVNGDQLDDFVVGDRSWVRAPHGQVGAAYVLFGSETVSGGDVSDPAAAGAVRIDGPPLTVPAGAWVGWSVSCLGDVNGDGLDDLVAGTGSRGYHDVAVIFGARDFGPVDLEDIGDRGYLISDPGALDTSAGDRATDNFGSWVGTAGDVDGDGLDDIAIGDVLADANGLANSGRVWVVRGKASTAPVDVRTDTGQVLLTVDGAEAGDRLATADAAGDVNGDGVDDLLVGSYVAAPWPGTTSAGAGYVVLGGDARAVDLSQPLGAAGFAINGPARDKDRLGISGAAIGDIDGDGLGDVVLGGDGVTNAGRAGGAAVVLGSTSTAPVLTDPDAEDLTVFHCADGAQDLDCAGSTKVARGYWINGAHAESKAGFAVAGLPDANGDDVPDVVLGAYAEGERGTAYVLYSDPARTAALDLADLTAAQGERHTPTDAGTAGTYGRTVGAAGDVDGNGEPDLFYGGASNNLALVLRGALRTDVALTVDEDAAAGQPVGVTAAVKALVPSVDQGLLDGTLALSIGGTPVTGLQEVPVTDGSASFELPAAPAGTLEVGAAFTPADPARLAPAEVTTSVSLAHAEAVVGSVTLSPASTVFGRGPVTVRVSVPGGHGGEVSFLEGERELATAAVGHDGTAQATLTRPVAGTHRITARFHGTDTLQAGEAEAAVLRVAKAQVRAMKVRGAAFARGARPRVRVVLGRLDNAAYPVGVVRVRAGAQSVKVRLVAADRGRAVVRLKRARSAVRVTATFTPADRANVASATAGPVRIRVRG